MKTAAICLVLPALALAACNSSSPQQGQAQPVPGAGSFLTPQQQAQAQAQAQAAAAAQAAVPQTPDRLVSFVVETGGIQYSFRRTGPDSWEGPSPDNGQIVEWSHRADASSLVLYTETPRVRTLSVYSDNTASCSCFDSNATISGASYQ